MSDDKTYNANNVYAGKLKVINLWAEPGAGKSTTAAGLFNLMKRENFEVELVTEVAKGLSYEKRFGALGNQLLVLAKQENQLRRLIGQCEYAIVDSPFPMGLIYQTYTDGRLNVLISKLWDDYDNFNFFITRSHAKPYQQFGRHHTESESAELQGLIADTYDTFNDDARRQFPIMDAGDPTVEYRMLAFVMSAQDLPMPRGMRDDLTSGIPGDGTL